MTGPLSKITVLDFSTLLPGPMATLLLAEAGAEVIKIERPGRGDEMRAYEPKWGADSVNFALLNRGKKSVAVDLKDAGERARLTPLIRDADVIVEQFRPGVMERLGLGFDAVRAINPSIIYCSITGYGQDGPKRDAAGHDLNYIGDSGLLALGMGDGARPVVPPALIADIAGGAYPAVMNILLALRERDRTGEGARLDIAMAENVFPFMYWAMGEGMAEGHWPGNGDALVTGGSPRYRIYPTGDGCFLAAAPLEDKFWRVFVQAIGLEESLRDDSRDPEATGARIAEIIAAKPSGHWRAILGEADCCCSIVQTVEDAMGDAHFRARGLFDETVVGANGKTLTALPVPIAPRFRTRRAGANRAPGLGSDTEDIIE